MHERNIANTIRPKSQNTKSSPFIILALLTLLGQAAGLAPGPNLRDEAKPGHVPSQAACQQPPHHPSGGWSAFLPPFLSLPMFFSWI